MDGMNLPTMPDGLTEAEQHEWRMSVTHKLLVESDELTDAEFRRAFVMPSDWQPLPLGD